MPAPKMGNKEVRRLIKMTNVFGVFKSWTNDMPKKKQQQFVDERS